MCSNGQVVWLLSEACISTVYFPIMCWDMQPVSSKGSISLLFPPLSAFLTCFSADTGTLVLLLFEIPCN